MIMNKWYKGLVVPGDRFGTAIGFPTLNIADPKILQGEKLGVYASFIKIGNETPRAYARGIFKYFDERNPPKHYPTSLKLRGVSAIPHTSTNLRIWFFAKADIIIE